MTRAAYNFIRGMGSVLELLPRRRSSRPGEGIDLDRTEAEALQSDWARVSEDFAAAFEREVEGKTDDVAA